MNFSLIDIYRIGQKEEEQEFLRQSKSVDRRCEMESIVKFEKRKKNLIFAKKRIFSPQPGEKVENHHNLSINSATGVKRKGGVPFSIGTLKPKTPLKNIIRKMSSDLERLDSEHNINSQKFKITVQFHPEKRVKPSRNE
jgi:hypothetical protein